MTKLGPSTGKRAVVCVDGITRAALQRITPDISWQQYVAWLRTRRDDLSVIHLRQPHDWWEILQGRSQSYRELIKSMVAGVLTEAQPSWQQVVVLGFSLGGLSALRVAHELIQALPQLSLEYAALVTLGTPFRGTGKLTDWLLKYAELDYIQTIFDVDVTRQLFKELLAYEGVQHLRILLGQIEHDEMVAPSSALLPAEWLHFATPAPETQWGTFNLRTTWPLRAHDGLLSDQLALAYIDGLVDGLLPPPAMLLYEPPVLGT